MKDSNDINKRIEQQALYKYPPSNERHVFIAGAKWWNNELIEEAIEKLQLEIKSRYIGHIWIMNTIKEVFESLKIKP